MKKFITIMIGCSLALIAGARAQQEEATQPPKKKQVENGHPAKEAQPAREAHPQNQPKPAHEAKPADRPEAAPNEHAGAKAPAETKATPEPSAAATKAPAKAPATATPPAKVKAEQAAKAPSATPPMTPKPASPAPSATVAMTPKAASPAPSASASAPSATPAASTTQASAASKAAPGVPPANKINPQAKKPDAQAVQAIKAQHANFKAQPKPQQVPSVTFNQSYRIRNSEQWQGEQYGAFRNYRPEMHDEGFYRSRYNRVELIGGGYYYFNAGYWYPAWGYSQSAQYYPYDGPVYAGTRAEPLDHVIADVQASLQEQGYYKGEVDGLLGPLTREALTGYQHDNGLYSTAVIDEPTLSSLGMG